MMMRSNLLLDAMSSTASLAAVVDDNEFDTELWGLGAACDSIEAVRLVMTVHEGNSSIRFVRGIKSLCERPWEVSFKHVYGERNQLVDGMVKPLHGHGFGLHRFNFPLSQLISVYQND
ncbi:hypothetical protein PVK06_025216 [Gossypium arboreum]|uniref:RNase H type-1 domain-containing protein n=1 Tax=Gossypium arboreum TaxID=29729 RepID=A0ABR0PFW3_GOSAR|nr:hypothetical protein PVK06_025216 [Gossypium arboreum]